MRSQIEANRINRRRRRRRRRRKAPLLRRPKRIERDARMQADALRTECGNLKTEATSRSRDFSRSHTPLKRPE